MPGRPAARPGVCAVLLALVGACAAGLAGAPAATGQEAVQAAAPRSIGDEIGSVRWREDYSFLRNRAEPLAFPERLKFIALNDARTAWLTLGGEVRERVESYDHAFFGLPGGRSFTAFATRLLADGDLHLGRRFRAFVELGSFAETGRKPVERPFDRGDLELQQGFFDLAAIDRGGERLILRLGRQELPLGSGRLVSLREAVNVRLTFDAAKLTWTRGDQTVEAFAGRPVEAKLAAFSSAPSGRESFWALDWTGRRLAGSPASGELFYLGRRLSAITYPRGTARELRHTLGGRLWSREPRWDYSVQAAYQLGTFGAQTIDAWGIATDTGATLASLPGRPRLALRADVASGDRDQRTGRDHPLGTFEAPYPALNYFSEASIFAPGNGYDVHPYLELRPAETLVAEVGADLLWRLRRGDAIYRAGGGILVPPGVSGARFVTTIAQLDLNWRLSPFLALQAAFVDALPGGLIRDAGGKATRFVLAAADLRF
jgi:Alginate export